MNDSLSRKIDNATEIPFKSASILHDRERVSSASDELAALWSSSNYPGFTER